MSADVLWDRAAKYLNLISQAECGGDAVSLMVRFASEERKDLERQLAEARSQLSKLQGIKGGCLACNEQITALKAERDENDRLARMAASKYEEAMVQLHEYKQPVDLALREGLVADQRRDFEAQISRLMAERDQAREQLESERARCSSLADKLKFLESTKQAEAGGEKP